MFEDKTLVCKDCGKEFVWTAGEQEFYASRGFENQPQRCKACRDARKNGARPASTGERKMYDAVCASCGKACKVPFQPREDRPVYCSRLLLRLLRSDQAELSCNREGLLPLWAAGALFVTGSLAKGPGFGV